MGETIDERTVLLTAAAHSQQGQVNKLIVRANRNRRNIILLAGAAALGVLISMGTLLALYRINDLLASRTQSRLAACQQDNAKTGAIRLAFTNGIAQLPITDPQKQTLVMTVLVQLPLRDCSPAGIDAYYTPTTSNG